MQPIRILTPELTLLGEIDNYLSLSFCRRFHCPGEFQLVTNRKIRDTDILDINNLIMLGANGQKVGIIRHKEIKTEETGEEIITLKGYTVESIIKQRITIPPSGQAYDIQEGDAESVIKNYVQRNCLDISEMAFPHFIIGTNQNRGSNIKWQSRYKNLGEELEQISLLTGLGWHLCLDLNQKKWVFDIYEGRDCSVSQQINPPVIFSPEFENVKSQEYVDSLFDFANYALVAGKGDGTEREIASIGTTDTGINRFVVFIDARDVESSDLISQGGKRLSEYGRIISFQSEVLTKGPFEYQKDWDIGDIVTIQNKGWDLILDSRVTEVTEIYEADGFKLNVTFGNSIPTLSQKFKSAFKEIKTQLTK